MRLNNVWGSYDLTPKFQGVPKELMLTQSEIKHEVLHHLISLWLSWDSLVSVEQFFDETNPESIQVKFVYYDKEKWLVTDTLILKNIRIIKKNIINSSSLDDQNANYRFNMARLNEEEQTLAWKIANAIKWWWDINEVNNLLSKYPTPDNPILKPISVDLWKWPSVDNPIIR